MNKNQYNYVVASALKEVNRKYLGAGQDRRGEGCCLADSSQEDFSVELMAWLITEAHAQEQAFQAEETTRMKPPRWESAWRFQRNGRLPA